MATSKTYTKNIDAAGKSLGRVASEAAKALMGKTHVDYTPNIRSDVKVTITNAGKLSVREKKLVQTKFLRYTGYPGGLKSESLQQLNARKPTEALRQAVERMLPRNTLRTGRLKNLNISL
ncbi:MAG TPA: 50S ribosomal protein L13 [Candidatus Paceibacterota bacterium]|nr:50S ribosomal protein L13 [Candidatus Paceibacterota bacterium]